VVRLSADNSKIKGEERGIGKKSLIRHNWTEQLLESFKYKLGVCHRHLSNIDCLMALTP
jgi:hypothetical protein